MPIVTYSTKNVGFGEISTTNGAGSQTLTLQNTYYKINQWNSNQPSQGVTSDYVNGQLTILDTDWYFNGLNCSINCDTNNATLKFALFINGVEHSNAISQVTTRSAGSATFNFSISDFNYLKVGDVLDVRANCTSNAGVSITVTQANLFCFIL